MHQEVETSDGDDGDQPARGSLGKPAHGCYGVQILIAGSRKHWRDCVSAEVRRAGFTATTVDSALDALAILVLGLPVDVLLTDSDLRGQLGCSKLAVEAKALRPNLSIILANRSEDQAEHLPDTVVMSRDVRGSGIASTVREVLAARAS